MGFFFGFVFIELWKYILGVIEYLELKERKNYLIILIQYRNACFIIFQKQHKKKHSPKIQKTQTTLITKKTIHIYN